MVIDEYEKQLEKTVLDTIPIGYNTNFTQPVLAYECSTDVPTIRQIIKNLRSQGVPIVMTSKGGYFIPQKDNIKDMYETQRFIDTTKRHAKEKLDACVPIEKWLGTLEQLEFEELKKEGINL